MKLIFEDRRRRAIKTKEEIKFSGFSSYHLIILTARAKSEKQLGGQATDDEDLTVKLNGKSFPKLGSDILIDSPAAFSGGRLHNLSKTVYFPSNQPKPDWVDEEKFTVQFGVTRFYKL